MQRSDVFPTFGTGFYADVRICGYHLRLFAHINETGWATSVYSMHSREWITEAGSADDEEEAKSKAEEIACRLLPGKHTIKWHTIGALVGCSRE
jgi:hypothetical protein